MNGRGIDKARPCAATFRVPKMRVNAAVMLLAVRKAWLSFHNTWQEYTRGMNQHELKLKNIT